MMHKYVVSKGNSSGKEIMKNSTEQNEYSDRYYDMGSCEKNKNQSINHSGHDPGSTMKMGVDVVQLRAQTAMLDVEESNEIVSLSKLLSNKAVRDVNDMTPEYIQEIRNFQYARMKRKEAYAKNKPLGFLQMHNLLTSFRTDLKWAKEVQERIKKNDV